MPSPRLKHFSGQVLQDRSVSDNTLIVGASATVDAYRLGGNTSDSGSILAAGSGNISMAEVGSLRAGQVLYNGTNTAIQGTVNTITGTGPFTVNVTVAGGTLTWAVGDRLTPLGTRPTLYKDAGKQTAYGSSQITAGSRGEWEFWAEVEGIDYLETVGTSVIKRNTFGETGNYLRSFEKDTAGIGAFKSDTSETWTLGNLWEWFNGAVRKAYVTAAGLIRAVGADLTGGTTTVDTLVVNTGSTFPAGDIVRADLAANIVHVTPARVDGTATDVAVSTTETDRITTTTYTPATGNIGLFITAVVPYEFVAVNTDNGHIKVRLYVAGVVKTLSVYGITNVAAAGTAKNLGSAVVSWFEPAVAGGSAITIKITDQLIQTAGTPSANYKGTLEAGRLFISEIHR